MKTVNFSSLLQRLTIGIRLYPETEFKLLKFAGLLVFNTNNFNRPQ